MLIIMTELLPKVKDSCCKFYLLFVGYIVEITIDRPREGTMSSFVEYSIEIKDERPEVGPMLSLAEHIVGITDDRSMMGIMLSIIGMQ